MKTDISKLPLKEWKHSLGVFLQMGRVQLDSDWNEQAELSLRLLQRQTEDVVRTGSPNHGFRVDDRILLDSMDVRERWLAEKANVGDPDPNVHVNYFDFKTGTGSLALSGASALVHKLKAPRDFSQWKEVVFAAKGSFADNECTFFLGQGATRGRHRPEERSQPPSKASLIVTSVQSASSVQPLDGGGIGTPATLTAVRRGFWFTGTSLS